jgi:hypothetical protein
MKLSQVPLLVASFLMLTGLLAPSHGAPATATKPAAESNAIEARRVCHHYRWSSRRHCTSANVLRFAARPPLYYPHKYFGGTPHYAQLYGYPYYWGYHHRWRYWRHRHHYPFY